ncbi:MAG: hypothetical protein IT458_16560 [Planctomycetes bacterium]|nr:hypothetical protein [Planctomycetota bacterium]
MRLPSLGVSLAVLLAGVCVPEALAQVRPGIYGYLVRGQAGQAGEFCHVFDCTPRALAVVAGETLTLTVNAPRQAVFGIAVAPSASGCIQIPGLANALVLDAPFFTLALGVVSQQSPVRACWDGRQDLSLPLPPTLPTGFQFATQAVAAVPLATGGDGPAFSVAVVTTVR